VGPQGLVPPSFTLNDLLSILGQVQFYSASPANFAMLFSGSWTNWFFSPLNTALAKLATMRAVLDKFNLHDAYLPGQRPAPVDCTGKTGVRQVDGTCNDTTDTMMGAANVRFGRNIPYFVPNPASPGSYVPNPKVYPDLTNLMVPNPREVSRKLFVRGTNFKGVSFLNMFAAAWVQFQVHDWFDHNNHTSEMFRVPLAEDDPLRRFRMTELVIPRTIAAPRSPSETFALPPVYANAVTHWWDASQVYGSDLATANGLRAKDSAGNLKAELAMDATGLLPVANDGFEQTGMRKNWWIGLALLHNLFAKEHNAIVAMLRQSHPEMDEQSLYDHARMINAALIAKIHTIEWTPAIIPNPSLAVGMNANWSGLKKYMANPAQDLPILASMMGSLPPDQAQAASSAVMGVLGNNRNLNGVPYAMTEDFVSVYRMHPLMPDKIKVTSMATKRSISYPTELTRMVAARVIERVHPMKDLMYSFGIEHPGQLVLQNYPRFLTELVLPNPLMITDMGTIDILRDRERGIPRYNDFREQLRMKRVASIEDLTPDPALRAALHEVYGADTAAIDRVDALVGTLGEATRPTCYGFGETLFQVFTLMATRRLAADRFYTNDYRPEIYTAEGLAWVNANTMKSVLLRHHPELGSTGLSNVANAFYPWQ
jgi:hypothetical protein